MASSSLNSGGADISLDDVHPFVAWYAYLWTADAAGMRGRDVRLTPLGARRFGVGVDQDGVPTLGVQERDVRHVAAVNWNAAAFVRNGEGDWVVLAAKDARLPPFDGGEAVPLRLWVPVASGMMDAWDGREPTKLRLRTVRVEKGRPVEAKMPQIGRDLPLTLKGFGAAR